MTLVSPSLPKMPNSKFMRIRLNLYEEDIAYQFDVHRTTVSRCFYRVLDVMHAKLSHLIKWPERERHYIKHFHQASGVFF